MPSTDRPVLLHGSSCFQCSADIIIEEEAYIAEYATGFFLTNGSQSGSCAAVTYSTESTDTESSPLSSEAAEISMAEYE